MKLKVVISILVFLVVLNLGAAFAFLFFRVAHQGGSRIEGMDRRPRAERRFGAPPSGMRLPREERRELRGLLRAFRQETSDLRLEVAELEDEVIGLMQQDPVPRAEVDALLEDIADIRLEISQKAIEKFIEAKSFLSPEGQELFFDAILNARPGGPGMGRFGDRPRGPRGKRERSRENSNRI